MKTSPGFKKFFYYGIIAVALLIIANYALNPNPQPQSASNNNSSTQNAVSDASKSNNTAALTENADIKILKSDITETAKFYPYKLDGTTMEVLAIKASDGTIRTALNTCQICFDSGRGYYKQIGDNLVCQNCGNQFNKDQVEIIKGGCNPIPIMEENKKDNGDTIVISKDYMATQKDYFSNWNKA